MKSILSFNKIPALAPWLLVLGLGLHASVVQAQNVLIGSLVVSQVQTVYVQEGQTVKAGQKLMDLDDARYRAKTELLQAKVTLANAQLQDAQIELDQALDLFDRTVTSRRTLDAAKLAHLKAKAESQIAQADLKMHQAWAKYVYIRAPISGKISKIFAPVGSTVFQENSPLVELAP
ncbi:hypothetical protein THMIRHAS_15870 [Thiosulfatimonas sediminis]|uniref:Multidrug resistance protein MdtA-like barrel-sandwich hybrid domain-containing protein n=1 Tax=Thiosulfatimonas sediminis TaxID=2675054 RepID=A0A6F8PW34_9GAMM|nr:efflux RND transporter periplasmic adaptor subunit [Thiosulfatimonas sediminis]BBP46214.1 hypothetical protein THMIRHAS_15870 [Thiosulfatimonas sediminis]